VLLQPYYEQEELSRARYVREMKDVYGITVSVKKDRMAVTAVAA